MAAVVCDAWQALPVADGVAALVLDVFAPRNPPEFRRVLRPGGKLLVVTPTARHLSELVTGLGLLSVDERKPERLEQALGADFVLLEQDRTRGAADAAGLPKSRRSRPWARAPVICDLRIWPSAWRRSAPPSPSPSP